MIVPNQAWLLIAEATGLLAFAEATSPDELWRRREASEQGKAAIRGALTQLQDAWAADRLVVRRVVDGTAFTLDPILARSQPLNPFERPLAHEKIMAHTHTLLPKAVQTFVGRAGFVAAFPAGDHRRNASVAERVRATEELARMMTSGMAPLAKDDARRLFPGLSGEAWKGVWTAALAMAGVAGAAWSRPGPKRRIR